MTPMVLVIRVRNIRACRLGRYSNFLAAAWTRSRVAGEMDFANGESFRTMEMVAGDRSRYSARVLSVTGLVTSGVFFLMPVIVLRRIYLLCMASFVHLSFEPGE